MKILVFIVVLLNLGLAHASLEDFEGSWKGTCETKKGVRELAVSAITKDSIIIDGDSFNIGKPTIRNRTGVDNGNAWGEVTVYDWSWNDDFSKIETNARWVGSYIEQNGAWSGNGDGNIQLVNGELKLVRKFTYEFNGNEASGSQTCYLNRQ